MGSPAFMVKLLIVRMHEDFFEAAPFSYTFLAATQPDVVVVHALVDMLPCMYIMSRSIFACATTSEAGVYPTMAAPTTSSGAAARAGVASLSSANEGAAIAAARR